MPDFRYTEAALKKLTESTGQDCYFWKATDGKWYMALEDRHVREDYDYYGPFDSKDEALDYLDKNFANPGGYSTDSSGTRPPPKKPEAAQATKPMARSPYYKRQPWR